MGPSRLHSFLTKHTVDLELADKSCDYWRLSAAAAILPPESLYGQEIASVDADPTVATTQRLLCPPPTPPTKAAESTGAQASLPAFNFKLELMSY